MTESTDFNHELQKLRLDIEDTLDLRTADIPSFHNPLKDAMRYAVLGGGKRLRGLYFVLMSQMFGLDKTQALGYAAAVEMIQAYSLVHDDLPAMDDDDMRRGKPSCHKAYGEAMAILAGDGLLNLAHELLLQLASHSSAACACSQYISRCAGVNGMIQGQAIDIFYSSLDLPQDAEELLTQMVDFKTAALFQAAICGPLLLAGVDKEFFAQAEELALKLGRVFQYQDDLLDCDNSAVKLGKSLGKDVRDRKFTALSFYGEAKLREKVALYEHEIVAELQSWQEQDLDTSYLLQLTEQVRERRF